MMKGDGSGDGSIVLPFSSFSLLVLMKQLRKVADETEDISLKFFVANAVKGTPAGTDIFSDVPNVTDLGVPDLEFRLQVRGVLLPLVPLPLVDPPPL